MNSYERMQRMVQMNKDRYPAGTRILLVEMGDDPRPVEPNTRGTVLFVDDIGTVHCAFDNGRQLGLVPGEDSFRKLTDEELTEQNSDKKLHVVLVEPGKRAVITDIDAKLESLQKLVGGLIQAVYPYEDPVALICNDEGKLEGLPLNRALRDEDGHVYDIVSGTFAVVGLREDDFGSLSEELAQKYAALFERPEQFGRFGNRVFVFSDEESPVDMGDESSSNSEEETAEQGFGMGGM